MGIRGLTTLVESHSRKILRDLSLNGTPVIIDGYGLLWYLFAEVHGADPMTHGGEYELFRSKIIYFFQNLMKCDCSPYVVFDGSFDLDGKKHNTLLERFKSRIVDARDVVQGGNGMLMPPLAVCLVKQVMTEIGVQFAFSQFEADREIAVLANQWHCPVIGKDSDFYVMDITGGYIPLTLLRWKGVQKFGKEKYYIAGQVYHVEAFCRYYKVKKELLPLFASLAGNDYVDSSSVNAFLSSQIYSQYECGNSKRQSQLEHLLMWVSEQRTYNGAFEEVLRHLPDRKTMKDLLSSSVAMYRTDCGSSNLKSFFEGCSSQADFQSNNQLCTVVGAPCWVAEAQQSGAVASLCMDIMSKGCCFSSVQVENPKEESAWMPSKFLFAVLSGIILADKKKKKENCIVYIRNGIGYQKMKVPPLTNIPICGRLPSLKDIPSLSVTDKQILLTAVLVPSLSSPVQCLCFPADFQLALLGTVHCLNSAGTKMTQFHLASLLTGWVYLYAQRKQKRRGKTSAETSDSQGQVDIESRVVEANLSHHQGQQRKRKPDAIVSHGFAQWQQCMLYVIHLNDILQCPLPSSPDVSVLYNGLVMHSMYATLRDVPSRENLQQWIGSRFFQAAPKALKLFRSMHDFVLTQTSREAQVKILTNKRSSSAASRPSHQASSRPRSQRGRQQRRHHPGGGCASASGTSTRDIHHTLDSDSDDEWRLNNQFAALSH